MHAVQIIFSAFLCICSSAQASTTPRVGDYVKYEFMTNHDPEVRYAEQEVLERDPTGARFLISFRRTLRGGLVQAVTSWLNLSEYGVRTFYNGGVDEKFAACDKGLDGAKWQDITVPAGTFKTCVVNLGTSGYSREVPFSGLVFTENEGETMPAKTLVESRMGQ